MSRPARKPAPTAHTHTPEQRAEMVAIARDLMVEHGLSPVWLAGKSPVAAGWNTEPSPCGTPDQFLSAYREGYNLGLRTGVVRGSCADKGLSLIVLDMDLSTDEARHEGEARAAVAAALGDELAQRPTVRTGSGRGYHWYFMVLPDDVPGFARRVLAASAESVAATQPDGTPILHEDGRPKVKKAWQIEVLSTGAQVVTMGSIHPDTGLSYEAAPGGRVEFSMPARLREAIAAEKRARLAEVIGKASGSPMPLQLPMLTLAADVKGAGAGAGVGAGAAASASSSAFAGIGQHQTIAPDVALSALHACDPDVPREEWLRVVWAAQAAGLSEDQVAEWSAWSNRYDAETFERDWASFDPSRSGGITAGTLLHAAGLRGWKRPAGFGGHEGVGAAGAAISPTSSASATVGCNSTTPSAPPEFTAEGGAISNGRALAAHHAERLRWSEKDGQWALFDGVRWLIGGDAVIDMQAQATADALTGLAARQVADEGGSRAAMDRLKRAQSLHRNGPERSEMLRAARPYLHGPPVSSYDSDPWLLVCPNGVVDLRDGSLRPATPADLVSRCTAVPYVAGAACPGWDRFLRDVFMMGDDGREKPEGRELMTFVRSMCGLLVTGSVEPEALFIWHGSGANGKSVMGKILSRVIGEYACAVSAHLLRKGQFSETEGERAKLRLVGARMGNINELEEGERWSSSRLKEVVSRDPISARRLYGETFEFVPTAKLVVRSNYLPVLTDETDGCWRRIIPVPFTRSFLSEQQDPQLAERLIREEGAGILSWLVQAAGDYYRSGEKLALPAFMRAEVGDLRASMSNFAEFIGEHLVRDAESKVSVDAVWKHWVAYAKFNNIHLGTKVGLGRKLGERGVRRGTDGRHYGGWKLAPMPSEWLSL